MSDETGPALGQTDRCRVCGRSIVFEGRAWGHADDPQPLHKAYPLSGAGGGLPWEARPDGDQSMPGSDGII